MVHSAITFSLAFSKGNPLIIPPAALLCPPPLNSKQISNSRLNSSLKSGPNDLIKNTYLYHLINLHSNLTKIDGEAQTLFYDEKNQKSNKAIDLEKELRKIDEKYNKMIDINKVIPFSK